MWRKKIDSGGREREMITRGSIWLHSPTGRRVVAAAALRARAAQRDSSCRLFECLVRLFRRAPKTAMRPAIRVPKSQNGSCWFAALCTAPAGAVQWRGWFAAGAKHIFLKNLCLCWKNTAFPHCRSLQKTALLYLIKQQQSLRPKAIISSGILPALSI